MPLAPVTLDDKYDLAKSRVFVTGFQALVRLALMQKERDRRAGLILSKGACQLTAGTLTMGHKQKSESLVNA